MIKAGVSAFYECDIRVDDAESIVETIWHAMAGEYYSHNVFPPTRLMIDKVEITEEMIAAAAEVVLEDSFLDLPSGSAERLAEKMLRRVFTLAAEKNIG